jgi:hypothetical protein
MLTSLTRDVRTARRPSQPGFRGVEVCGRGYAKEMASMEFEFARMEPDWPRSTGRKAGD